MLDEHTLQNHARAQRGEKIDWGTTAAFFLYAVAMPLALLAVLILTGLRQYGLI